MTSAPILVVGAGGHAATVADALLQAGREVIGFLDSTSCVDGRRLCGLPVFDEAEHLAKYDNKNVRLVNGIGGVGDPSLRIRVQRRLEGFGWEFTGIIHPSAVISPFAVVASDAQVLARSVIHAYAEVRTGCITNTGVIVEHHASIGSWTHLAPGSVICGAVRVGEACHVGAGAVLIQGVELGPWTTVGAGACVIRSFQGNGVLVGVPAKQVEN